MEGVHLSNRGAHLADLDQQPTGDRRKRQEALFKIDSLLAERHEEIGPGVRIDDRLEGRF